MNEAIKLAIDNGWNAHVNSAVVTSGAFALEPEFWQALGKALGWKRQFAISSYGALDGLNDDGVTFRWDGVKEDDHSVSVLIPEWQDKAHTYLDLVLTGGDTDKFWKELLTPHQ